MQEAFVRALLSISTFRGESPLAAWVWRIAISVGLEQRRQTSRRQSQETTDEAISDAVLVDPAHAPTTSVQATIGRVRHRAPTGLLVAEASPGAYILAALATASLLAAQLREVPAAEWSAEGAHEHE